MTAAYRPRRRYMQARMLLHRLLASEKGRDDKLAEWWWKIEEARSAVARLPRVMRLARKWRKDEAMVSTVARRLARLPAMAREWRAMKPKCAAAGDHCGAWRAWPVGVRAERVSRRALRPWQGRRRMGAADMKRNADAEVQ